MAEKTPQTYANHAKNDPPFHFFALPLSFLNFLYAVYLLVTGPSVMTAWTLVMAAVLVVTIFLVRVYPLKVQDRLIRMEERMRLQTLLPESLKPRIAELTEKQLVALRFASDGEVAALVQETLSKNLPPAEIKKLIKSWRPDYYRV